jgi:hypothetical protein
LVMLRISNIAPSSSSSSLAGGCLSFFWPSGYLVVVD